MTIEFTNATPAKQSSLISNLLLGLSFVFLFAPITLIVLGYYTSLPTGTLVSPIPQGVLSTVPTPSPKQDVVIANQATEISSASATTQTNSQEKTVTIVANTAELTVTDPAVLESSQIYLTNKEGDKSLYSIKSKSVGQFVVVSNSVSNQDRLVDYHIVNP
ncbi:hypothetical protein A2572_00225 [Candidatus Collierbacteria bacterium RIFOXYD1_FULL_40_9]|uniref:Uncharacterized protein n=1 Tax=Candidatus Collierbacteria bacterium RIFOXYD1_FULL_40_9 TaxID=1817731 RepID=A0A1F5FV42_9BACT|nr:MAG: hypothetical protein A2572_00225 [Candidatus Collierbacteria bacterium RIFOXYD1_FULL_40_9]